MSENVGTGGQVMSRLGRWLTVRIVAWAMRRGLDTAVIDEAARKSHPHRTQGRAWLTTR